jgi:hypothetical protein
MLLDTKKNYSQIMWSNRLLEYEEKIQVEYISHYFPLVVQENGIDKKKQYIKYNDSNSLTASRAIARALQLVLLTRICT